MSNKPSDKYDLEACHHSKFSSFPPRNGEINEITLRDEDMRLETNNDDADNNDEPSSYLSTSYNDTAVGDESTVGAWTTNSELVRGIVSARNAKLGQEQREMDYHSKSNNNNKSNEGGRDDKNPSFYVRTIAGQDYSMYDLSVADYGVHGDFETVDIESPPANNKNKNNKHNKQSTLEISSKPNADTVTTIHEQAPAHVTKDPRFCRLEVLLFMVIIFAVAFLAVFFVSSRFLN